MKNFPFLLNFATRVPEYASATTEVRNQGSPFASGISVFPFRRSAEPDSHLVPALPQLPIVRSLTPMISVAAHHMIFLAMAFKNTSCSFHRSLQFQKRNTS